MKEIRCTPETGYIALVPLMFPSPERIRPPRMRPPFIYVIDYSRNHWDDFETIREFADAPPDLMHVGKAVPILHNWGAVPLAHAENQVTGRPLPPNGSAARHSPIPWNRMHGGRQALTERRAILLPCFYILCRIGQTRQTCPPAG